MSHCTVSDAPMSPLFLGNYACERKIFFGFLLVHSDYPREVLTCFSRIGVLKMGVTRSIGDKIFKYLLLLCYSAKILSPPCHEIKVIGDKNLAITTLMLL